jgi:hypothetical protein
VLLESRFRKRTCRISSRVTFIDGSNNYKTGTVSASRIAGYPERRTDVTLPLVMDEIQAQLIADRALTELGSDGRPRSMACRRIRSPSIRAT